MYRCVIRRIAYGFLVALEYKKSATEVTPLRLLLLYFTLIQSSHRCELYRHRMLLQPLFEQD